MLSAWALTGSWQSNTLIKNMLKLRMHRQWNIIIKVTDFNLMIITAQ
jgi:hypothetical protein